MQKLLASFIFTLGVTSVAFASQDEPSQIKVTSTEMQFGKVVANSTKQGVPADLGAAHKPSALAKTIKPSHLEKQLATPLVKPFDRDARLHNGDPDFWIFDAFVTFDTDLDYDGYYSTFTVEFDADTIYVEAPVYARLYLSRGTVFEEYLTTSLFYINGESSEDSYVVQSTLETGFPSDDYEVLIELYDGDTDALVASFDGYNDADLTLLPLESRTFETRETVVVVESGGSFGYLMLLLVPLLWRKVVVNQPN